MTMHRIFGLFVATLLVLTVCGSAGIAGTPSPEPAIALVSKVVLEVSHKEFGKDDWEEAKRGEPLSSGDRVMTGPRSIAVIKFKDNSLVRVREKTELTVTGKIEGRSFSKSVNVERGVVGFNIQKQRSDEEFRFTSPTSVASIRGTGGQFSSDEGSDKLTVTEGLVRFTNTISSEFVDVGAGFTGISNPDGSITVRPSTPEEQEAALRAARVNEQDNKLEIELRDAQGNRRHLRIDYRE